MRDNKAFASLTSGLLARKGQARPAMRPQGFTQGISQNDDLGWNDMGHDVPRFAGARLPAGLAGPQASVSHEAPAAIPEVLRQQDEIAREFGEPAGHEIVEDAVPAEEPVPAEAAPDIEEAVAEAVLVIEEAVAETVAVEPIAAESVAVEPVAAVPVVAVPARARRDRRPSKAKAPVVAPHTAGRKAAFTLRLASERHLLLRLACAVQNRSAQQIVTEALDRFLADLPDVARLAASLPHED